MCSKTISVTNESGLYAQHATNFVHLANEFQSTLCVEFGDQRVNAKSLLGVLSLGIHRDDVIRLTADGDDAEKAIKAMSDLLTAG